MCLVWTFEDRIYDVDRFGLKFLGSFYHNINPSTCICILMKSISGVQINLKNCMYSV